MLKMGTEFYTVFWNGVLGQIYKTSEILQNPSLDVNTTATALSSLKSFIQIKRGTFEEYEREAAA